MKTTENISLGGFSFTIESDAFAELEKYLSEIRECFKEDAGAEEITEDIEVRIAELLNERYRSGFVVNLPMIREIKSRIGDPRELAREEADNTAEHPKEVRDKRMYRDIDERVLGGVCSGLGAYFGIDKVLFRIIFLIFFLIGFLGIDDGPYFGFALMAYICLWIAMPAARTVEQKCRMKGKPISLESFRSKENNFGREVKEVVTSPLGRTLERTGKVFLGLILLICGIGGLLSCIFIPSLPSVIDHLCIDEWPLPQLCSDTTFWGLVLVMCGLLFIWFLYNGVMLTFGLKSPSWKPGLVLFIAWLISIFILVAWVLKYVADALPTLI